MLLDGEAEDAPTLGDIVGAYKNLVRLEWDKIVRSGLAPTYMKKFWQDSYIDRVLRNESELNQKRTYINNNPIVQTLKQQGHQ